MTRMAMAAPGRGDRVCGGGSRRKSTAGAWHQLCPFPGVHRMPARAQHTAKRSDEYICAVSREAEQQSRNQQRDNPAACLATDEPMRSHRKS
jgi:hypothetical protein